MVKPAIERGGFEHGVFTADLVGEGGHAEFIFDAAHDVQIRHAGLDHHHIGALGDVHCYFAQRFVRVAGVHLVDLFVALAQIGRRAHGIAKRAVKRRSVLGAVGHDAGVDEVPGFQGLANGTNAAVHHVTGRHNINARFGLREGLLHQHFNGGLVHDVAVLSRVRVREPVLPVAGEGVQRHIGHHTQVRKFFFKRSHHAGDQTLGVQGFAPVPGFKRGVNDREQSHDRNTQLDALLGHW